MKFQRALLIVLAIALVAVSAVLAGKAEKVKTAGVVKAESAKSFAPTVAAVGKAAPDFVLTDAAGKSHSLSDYEGKYVVLEWINFQCPFVRKHYDSGNMQKLQNQLTKQGVVWLSICSSAPGKQGHFEGDELNKLLKENKYAGTAYLTDASGMVGKLYGAKTTPNMFVINPKGTLIYAGAIDDKPTPRKEDIAESVNYVTAALQQSMSGKEVAVRATQPYGCSVKYAGK
jgi:peroxiredoxin